MGDYFVSKMDADMNTEKAIIPKQIHYIWFGGGKKSELFYKCFASWKKYMPDYEIIEWNEDNFDIDIVPYVRQAYDKKKWAFASDYARFWILYQYGGVYLDTDVELIKSLDDILCQGCFMGFEQGKVAPGLGMGINPGLGIIKEILDAYKGVSFDVAAGLFTPKTVVEYTTEILKKHGLRSEECIQEIEGIRIYPSEYFCPYNMVSQKLLLTENTHTIHWYDASWYSDKPMARKMQFLLLAIKTHLRRSVDGVWGDETYNKLKKAVKNVWNR